MLTAIHSPAPFVKKSSLYGSFANRFVASLVDTTILVFWYSIILYSATDAPLQHITLKEVLQGNGISLQEAWFVIESIFVNPFFPVLHWLYYTMLEASPKQATIGKYTLGLRVSDLRGKRISFAQANFRYFSKLVSALPVFLGFLLIMTTRRNQMLHDYLARTVVVTEQ